MILNILNSITPGWQKEFKFHPSRRWRADFAHPQLHILIEIEGGIWINGRHTSGPGYLKDMEKYNATQILGFRLLRYGISKSEIDRMISEVSTIISNILKDIKNLEGVE